MKEKIAEMQENMSPEPRVQAVLEKLDEMYGITKEGFYHHHQWQLLVAIMLSAQSTDKQVDTVLPTLCERFKTVLDMAQAPMEEIEECIRTIGLYKIKAKNIKRCCNQILSDYGGEVPSTIEGLLTLAGVGRKTATLYLADAYGIAGVTVDTHVFRISKRLGWAKGKNPKEVELELQKVLPKEYWNRINFQLIYHGRGICTSRKAHCQECQLEMWCDKIL